MGKRQYDAKRTSIAIGSTVRKLRHERGWTLEECEEHGWLNWRYLQEIESGKGNITVKTIVNLANLFGVKPSDLLKDI